VPGKSGTGTDGYQQKNGTVRSFVLIPTTEVDTNSQGAPNTLIEIYNDIKKIKSGITAFNAVTMSTNSFTYTGNKQTYNGILVFDSPYKLPAGQEVFIPFSRLPLFDGNTSFPFRRVYMIVSDDVVDDKKYQTFKTAMIGNIINNTGIIGKGSDNISEVFDAYWNKVAKPAFVEENNITKEFITYMEKEKLKDFLKYTPYSTKKRMFNYTTEDANSEGQVTLIKGLGATQNQNTNNKTWNDEISADVYISKAKLN
jgi:hypothetical protein